MTHNELISIAFGLAAGLWVLVVGTGFYVIVTGSLPFGRIFHRLKRREA